MQNSQELNFLPPWYLRSGHLQTLAGLFWRTPQPMYQAQQHAIRLPDGDQIILHEDSPPDWTMQHGIALLIHGLAGCHQSGYMVRITAKLVARGVRVFRMDMRGSGAASGLARMPAHAGRTEDAAAAIHRIAELYPQAPLTLVGFSMGGNIALGTLANAAAQPIGNLRRGIAIAPPVDLSRCCRELREGTGRYYDRYLIRFLVSAWEEMGTDFQGKRPKSIYEFDDRVTAPVSGFKDAEDYYAHCSSGPRLREITLPTKVLAAKDDPVVAFQAIETAPRSPHVELCVTRSGGHLGYMTSRREIPDRRWLDHQVVNWVCAVD